MKIVLRKAYCCCVLLFTLICLSGASSILAQNKTENQPNAEEHSSNVNLLELNKPVERELKAQEIHTYSYRLRQAVFCEPRLTSAGLM